MHQLSICGLEDALDERIDAPILEQMPRVLGRWDVGLSEQSNLDVCVA
jgi:hypothetical protein